MSQLVKQQTSTNKGIEQQSSINKTVKANNINTLRTGEADLRF